MRALASPASLKGVLTASEAAAALVAGLRRGGAEAAELPVADGGEGTAAVLAAALGGVWREADVADPLGRRVRARWLELPDGTGVVDSAEAVGLGLLRPEERDPLRASSHGLGELIAAMGERSLVVGLGGSATVDAGAGMLEVVESLPSETTVLHDVRTTLRDSARLYGPQKGARPEDIAELEARLDRPELRPYADLPGAGAAGGLGAALASLGGRLVPGAPYILERVDFVGRAREVDLVVTAEGAIDETTLAGKAPAAVAEACRILGVRCVVAGGRVERDVPGAETIALSGDPARAREDLEALGERLARAG